MTSHLWRSATVAGAAGLMLAGLAASDVLAQNYIQDPGFETGPIDFVGTGSGVTSNSATWGNWYAFNRWRRVVGATATTGVDTTGSCPPGVPQSGATFPSGWSDNKFAQHNPDFAGSCDQADKLVQGFDGLQAPSGTTLTLSFKYINQNPQNRSFTVWVCGLNAGQSIPLFVAGGGCGTAGGSAGTQLYSAPLATTTGWENRSASFNVGADYSAIAVAFELGGRVYPPDLRAGVDDVFLGIPNQPPVCDAAEASPSSIWPPNHEFVPIEILGVTDPDGDPVTVSVTGIKQDEPVNGRGDGNTTPDATGVGTDQPSVRAERSGRGNGRVYTIQFSASDDRGGSCSGAVTVSVPKSQNGQPAVDDGPTYDSTNP